MSLIAIHTVDVQFGDCDPADSVFFPNFLRWMDAAALAFFQTNRFAKTDTARSGQVKGKRTLLGDDGGPSAASNDCRRLNMGRPRIERTITQSAPNRTTSTTTPTTA